MQLDFFGEPVSPPPQASVEPDPSSGTHSPHRFIDLAWSRAVLKVALDSRRNLFKQLETQPELHDSLTQAVWQVACEKSCAYALALAGNLPDSFGWANRLEARATALLHAHHVNLNDIPMAPA